jgi:hypothetical protein
MANILLRERLKNPTAEVGINWTSRFSKRRPEVRTRYNRRITYQRAKQEDPRVITQQSRVIHTSRSQKNVNNIHHTYIMRLLCDSNIQCW